MSWAKYANHYLIINEFGPYPQSNSNPWKKFRLKKWDDGICSRMSVWEWIGDKVRQNEDYRWDDNSEGRHDNEMKDGGFLA